MSERLRLFVAALPSAPVRESLEASLGERPDSDAVRWIDPESWHLTLQFLGSVERDMIDRIRLACAFAAGRVRPFEVTLSDVGAFPSERRARVVWIGVRDPESRLEALATALQDQTAKLGFEPEEREFHAHLTIGRLRNPADVVPIVSSMEVADIGAEVAEIALMQSVPGPGAAAYSVIDTFPMQS
jgi:2'-5' RNA ligase